MLPMTASQEKLLASLTGKAIRNQTDQGDYYERLVECFGEPFTLIQGEQAWRREFLTSDGERLNRATASTCIGILKTMAAEPRCEGYCRERGVQHRHVHYYDGHYDFECGLS
jgi:hypothetical protein